MNEKEANYSDEQELVDRLVDGELDEAQQREALVRLEHSPDGWRRCALAFLEAQTWGRELKSWQGDAHVAADTPGKESGSDVAGSDMAGNSLPGAPRDSAPMKSWWRGPQGSLLGMAASFLIAFGLGLAWRTWDGVDRPVDQGSLATNSRPSGATGGMHNSPGEAATHWATASVPVKGASGETEQLDVPVAMGPAIDAQWLRDQPSALPGQLLRELERRGHRVQQNRQYIPFELEDGRQVIFPVDQVDVRLIGERLIP